ncbi:MAG: hypothetical protein LBQ51_03560 [Desulfovibrio sp.]|nr:hypothetical protein [Desulfovibrio sp.]
MIRIPAILPRIFLFLPLLPLLSCSTVRVSWPAPALTGPPLHIAGEYSGMSLEGTMDRGCMAGVGTLNLRAVKTVEKGKKDETGDGVGPRDEVGPGDGVDPGEGAGAGEGIGPNGGVGAEFTCSGKVDAPPDRKARVNGVLECTSGRRMAFSLRNLGPDQGLGIARETREDTLMVFFYHAAESEAKRRLPEILSEMEIIRAAAEPGREER